jgi:superfamily I DNA and/or RNA helicase/very-short-patch-repair endonuclease
MSPENFDLNKIKLQLKRWQEKLLDVSKANPLLGINRGRSSKIKITEPAIYEFFNNLVLEENEFRLPFVKRIKKKKAEYAQIELTDSSEEEKEIYKVEDGDLSLEMSTPADLKRKLRRIYDNSRITVEERGVITLYATFGTIHWDDAVLGESVSPILLVPCEIIYKGLNAPMRLHIVDEDIQINPALIYYFREKHKIDFSEFTPEFLQGLDKNSLKDFFNKIQKNIKDQEWEVNEELWLGTFSFESLALYQDLKLLTEVACLNPLIAAFAHALNKSSDKNESLGEDLDSLETPKIVPVPILPADSSQLEALTYSSLGRNLVIYGPPGTGKSQTISNIIADALRRNKKVLFVSAKMAALNVVFDRLKKEGLGQFCLEAHGVKAGKLKIVEELKRTLEQEDCNSVGPLEEELENLQKTRKQLNDYISAIHTVIDPLGFTIFQAVGRFSKLNKVPDVRFSPTQKDILSVSKNELNDCIDALSNIAQMGDLFDSREKNPWRGLTRLDLDVRAQEQIETDLRFLCKIYSDLVAIVDRLELILPEKGLNLEELLALVPALDAVSKIKKLPEKWWSMDVLEIEAKEGIFKEAFFFAKEFQEKNALYSQFSNLTFKETANLLSEINISFRSWTNRLTVSYLKWKKDVKNKLNKNIKLSSASIKSYCETAKRLVEIKKWFEQKEAILREEILTQQIIDVGAISEVIGQCEAAILLRKSLPNYSWKKSKIVFLDQEISNASAALVSTINEKESDISFAGKRVSDLWPNGFVGEVNVLQAPLEKFIFRAKEILENLNKIRDWVLLQRSIKHCEDLGIGSFIDSAKDIKASLLPSVFEKRFLFLWVNGAIDKNKYIAEFSSIRQQELIEKFKILDNKIRRLAKMQVRASAALDSKRVRTAQSGLGNSSEIGTLRFEMQKRKRIKPLRKLFSEIPHVLQALKPCMLMSPISVSTYLKPETFHFDIVIFDEASQLPTPEAIPSILRADQVVVAGDSKQLPPTSFFNSSLIGDSEEDFENEQFQESLESLLDDCKAIEPIFQEAPLKWHYRSRDERLISFSNHYFYDNQLITFPPNCIDDIGRGIRLEYLSDGVWDRGKSRKNRREARKAAKLAIEHFTNFPERSLGVVALNASQREAIEEAIGEELLDRPDLQTFFDTSRQHEPFFVKSLENVQGDERDVILISVGYGKSADGNLTLNFGPLNMDGGWRRLNVLVTRAKWQIILLTSLRSSELHRINPQNLGASALKNFIEYAERGGLLPVDTNTTLNNEVETNDFEDSVRDVLTEKGFSVDAQVGVGRFRIDLAVKDPKNPSKYLIGIECDGATYHSSKVARDRDLLREEILRDMGWNLHRVWSTEWFHNRELAIQLMLDSIKRVASRGKQKPTGLILPEKEEYDFEPIIVPEIERRYKCGMPYFKYNKKHRKETLMKKGNTYQLGRILIDIMETEGPIHDDVLNERLKEVFGVEKIGNNIRTNVEEAIKNERKRGYLEREKPFTWEKGNELETFRTPCEGIRRPLCYISPQELSLAILYLAEDQFGIMRQSIPQSVSKVFEIARNDTSETDRISETTDKLIDDGKLIVNGNQVNISI